MRSILPAGHASTCHVCGASSTFEVDGSRLLMRVTSDCLPFPARGTLIVCLSCGCVQKPVDEEWRSQVDAIYGRYNIYHQSGGREQAAFDPAGSSEPRSLHLLDWITSRLSIGESGRLLDVGCGNGALLRSFAQVRPKWRLTGQELNARFRDEVEELPGVERFHVGDVATVAGEYDIITMIHVLEHVPDPVNFLRVIRTKLKRSGLLLIQVPNYVVNPFDLVVVDHCTHFSLKTLRLVLETARFVPSMESSSGSKEISVVAQTSSRPPDAVERDGDSIPATAKAITWLMAVRDDALKRVGRGPLGVFGTSIAATWVTAEVPDVQFFVDEDQARIGRTHLGRPILSADAVPPGASVLVALSPESADAVCGRIKETCPGVLVMPPVRL